MTRFQSDLSFLSTVAPYEFGLAQSVALHCALDFSLSGSRFQVKLGIEGVELEIITMGIARRRAWTAVADFAKVIAPL